MRADMRIRPALARRAAAVVRQVRAELGGGQAVKVSNPLIYFFSVIRAPV